MKEKAPANVSMPPQPARKEGRLTVAMGSERTGARRYRLPRVQWPEAWPSKAVGPVVFTAAPLQKVSISESTSAPAGGARQSEAAHTSTNARAAMVMPAILCLIVMSDLPCGEGEDALGELVLGDHAEGNRKRPPGSRVVEDKGGEDRGL